MSSLGRDDKEKRLGGEERFFLQRRNLVVMALCSSLCSAVLS